MRAQSTDSVDNDVAPVPFSESRSAIASPAQDEATVYQQKLDEAYRALDDAYAQIRLLQTPGARFASAGDGDKRFTEHDGEDDHRKRSRRHDSDDH